MERATVLEDEPNVIRYPHRTLLGVHMMLNVVVFVSHVEVECGADRIVRCAARFKQDCAR